MKRLSAAVHTLFGAALLAVALVCFLLDHQSLWGSILLAGAFALLTVLQPVLLREGGGNPWLATGFIVLKAGLALGSALLWKGLGPVFLFCIVVLDLCLAYPLPWSAILAAAGAGGMLAFTGGSRDAIILQAVLAGTVYLLALLLKNEQALLRATAETISCLRVNEKKLRDTNRQIELFNDRLADAARMQERSRIAKGIHDTLGHMLTAIVVQLSAALETMGQDDAAARGCVQNARDQAQSGLESVRETIHMLDDAGASFSSKLKRAIGIAEKSMQIQVLALIEAGVEPGESAQQLLLSCLKEGLTNGVRHGHATAFVCRVEKAAGAVSFYLEDNGEGCAKLAKGFGLTAMEESVEQSGGTFEAAGMLSEGFYLRITLPHPDQNGA